MRISKISIAGFRGVLERLDLDVGDSFLVLTGRNGSGKSTICDAIEFALTGKISRLEMRKEKGESVADYLWWRGEGSPSDRLVRLTFIKESGEPLTIERRPENIAQNITELRRADFCDVNTPSSEWVNDLVRTMMLRDETIAALSLDLGETDRFQFVEDAIGVSTSADQEQLVTKAIALITSRRDKSERAHALVRERVLAITSELSRIRERTASDESASAATRVLQSELNLDTLDPKSIETRLSELRWQYREVEVGSHELSEELRHRADLERQASDSQTINARADVVNLESLIPEAEQRLEALEVEIAVTGSRADARTSFAQLAALGEKLGARNGRCPLCASEVSPEHFDAEIERLKREAGEESSRYAAAVALREQVTSQLADMQGRRHRLRQLLTGIDDALERSDARLVQLRSRIQTSPLLDDLSRESITKWLTETAAGLRRAEQAAIDLLTVRLLDGAGETERELEQAKREAEGAGLQVEKLRTGEELLKELLRVIKQVTKEIADERLAAAEPLLVDLYRRLRPHSDWREVSYKVRGEIRKFLSFRVGDDINPSFVFSSGQRRAAGLAFLLAVHLARTWCRLNTLILDDPVQHIDDFRALHLVEVLSAIRKTDRQIICCVEDPALADLLVRRLQVAPLGSGSRVELRYDPVRGVVIDSDRKAFALPQDVLRTA